MIPQGLDRRTVNQAVRELLTDLRRIRSSRHDCFNASITRSGGAVNKRSTPTIESGWILLLIIYYFAITTSAVSIASFTRSSIFSLSFLSLRSMTSMIGFVTGCLATKIVQQSSYGRIDVS